MTEDEIEVAPGITLADLPFSEHSYEAYRNRPPQPLDESTPLD